MNGRKVIIGTMCTAALGLSMTACALDSGASGETVQNPDAGLTLLSHPSVYAAMGGDTVVSEFMAETGIEVEVVTAEIGPHLDKLTADYQAGTGTYDVVALQNIDYMPRIREGLAPLDAFIEDAPEEWDFDDFIESLRSFSNVDGIQYGIPVRLGTQMLYYRADIFEENNIAPPETLAEFSEAAQTLADVMDYGDVQRGQPRQLVNDWLGFLYAAGGELVSESGTCALESAAGVTSLELFTDFYGDGVLPEDYFAWGRDEYISAMQQGSAAMGVYYSPYWGYLVDPESSTAAEDMAFAVAPVAEGVEPGTSRAQVWNLSIPTTSANQAGAWQFIEFVTNKTNSLRAAEEFSNGPVRTSTYEDPGYLQAVPVAEAWQRSAEVAKVDPPIDELPRIIDILAEHLTEAIQTGADSGTALAGACEQINGVLD